MLLTIGLAFISVSIAAYIFGTTQQPVETPALLRGGVDFLGLGLGKYRLFLVGTALVVTVLLVAGLEYAGLGGALAIEIVGLDPNFAFTYLVYVLIIVSVGGLGSIAGSFAAAILIGVSDVAGKYYAPELGAFLIYLVMVVVLMWRPAGLFGRR